MKLPWYLPSVFTPLHLWKSPSLTDGHALTGPVSTSATPTINFNPRELGREPEAASQGRTFELPKRQLPNR